MKRFLLLIAFMWAAAANAQYMGDKAEDATVPVYFWTYAATGAPVAPSSALETADVVIYKDGDAAQKATTNGLTMTSPFDSITGYHLLSIDTAVNTGDTGFWTAGSLYTVVLSPDETVDGVAAKGTVASFTIGIYASKTESAITIWSTLIDTIAASEIMERIHSVLVLSNETAEAAGVVTVEFQTPAGDPLLNQVTDEDGRVTDLTP